VKRRLRHPAELFNLDAILSPISPRTTTATSICWWATSPQASPDRAPIERLGLVYLRKKPATRG
jgi:hypothetical protein